MSLGSAITHFVGRNSRSTTPQDNGKGNFPFLNSFIRTNRGQTIASNYHVQRKQKLMKYYERWSAILSGIINKVARDINEQVYFEPYSQTSSGRNKVQRSDHFYQRNLMRQTLFSNIVDFLILGEGYAYKNRLSSKELHTLASCSLKKKGLPQTPEMCNLYLKANFPDEVDLTLRKLVNLPSSTVENIYDEHSILEYVQKVGSVNQRFLTEDVIHIKPFDVNGRVYGFTPLFTLIDQLELDYFMWQNMKTISKNSGQPDKIYSVEDVDINSPAFKRIERNLKKYHQLQNRHGSLLLNGKVTVQDLTQLDSMQFENLGVYIAGLIALQWSIPRSRLPFMSKEANVKEDTGGNSEKDYYDNIEYIQDIICDIYNQQLWIPHFGTVMKFKKRYKQDEVRETQIVQIKLDNLTKIEAELARNGKQLNQEYKLRYFNGVTEQIMPEDLEDLKPEKIDSIPENRGTENQPSNASMQDTPQRAATRDQRQSEQESREETRGEMSGSGKEDSQEVHLSFKEMLTKEVEHKEVQRVPFATFMRLYNEDKAYNKNPPRVFQSERDGITRFVYKSTDFVYECYVPSSEISKSIYMNFRQVYRLPENELLEVLDSSQPEDEEDTIPIKSGE